MRNAQGLTVTERINRDIDNAELVTNEEHRKLLAHMAISAAELAVDYNMITYREWGRLTRRAFAIM